ncbi:hypothetical protein BH09PSE4_BH09PSE4_13920 [soil metagenome]
MEDRGLMQFLLKLVGTLVILAAFAFGMLWGVQRYIGYRLSPNIDTIATSSLQGLREQNRMSAFAARYVAVVTSKQSRMGLTAQKTLIMPGMVQYEVDLSKLKDSDLKWDVGSKTLNLRLPPIEVQGPQVDLTAIREYDESGLLSTFTDANTQIDAANRAAGQKELVRQAHEAMPMKIARDATRRAIERNFEMPLRAAGVNASVKVTFADENNDPPEYMDASRDFRDVVNSN